MKKTTGGEHYPVLRNLIILLIYSQKVNSIADKDTVADSKQVAAVYETSKNGFPVMKTPGLKHLPIQEDVIPVKLPRFVYDHHGPVYPLRRAMYVLKNRDSWPKSPRAGKISKGAAAFKVPGPQPLAVPNQPAANRRQLYRNGEDGTSFHAKERPPPVDREIPEMFYDYIHADRKASSKDRGRRKKKFKEDGEKSVSPEKADYREKLDDVEKKYLVKQLSDFLESHSSSQNSSLTDEFSRGDGNVKGFDKDSIIGREEDNLFQGKDSLVPNLPNYEFPSGSEAGRSSDRNDEEGIKGGEKHSSRLWKIAKKVESKESKDGLPFKIMQSNKTKQAVDVVAKIVRDSNRSRTYDPKRTLNEEAAFQIQVLLDFVEHANKEETASGYQQRNKGATADSGHEISKHGRVSVIDNEQQKQNIMIVTIIVVAVALGAVLVMCIMVVGNRNDVYRHGKGKFKPDQVRRMSFRNSLSSGMRRFSSSIIFPTVSGCRRSSDVGVVRKPSDIGTNKNKKEFEVGRKSSDSEVVQKKSKLGIVKKSSEMEIATKPSGVEIELKPSAMNMMEKPSEMDVVQKVSSKTDQKLPRVTSTTSGMFVPEKKAIDTKKESISDPLIRNSVVANISNMSLPVHSSATASCCAGEVVKSSSKEVWEDVQQCLSHMLDKTEMELEPEHLLPASPLAAVESKMKAREGISKETLPSLPSLPLVSSSDTSTDRDASPDDSGSHKSESKSRVRIPLSALKDHDLSTDPEDLKKFSCVHWDVEEEPATTLSTENLI